MEETFFARAGIPRGPAGASPAGHAPWLGFTATHAPPAEVPRSGRTPGAGAPGPGGDVEDAPETPDHGGVWEDVATSSPAAGPPRPTDDRENEGVAAPEPMTAEPPALAITAAAGEGARVLPGLSSPWTASAPADVLARPREDGSAAVRAPEPAREAMAVTAGEPVRIIDLAPREARDMPATAATGVAQPPSAVAPRPEAPAPYFRSMTVAATTHPMGEPPAPPVPGTIRGASAPSADRDVARRADGDVPRDVAGRTPGFAHEVAPPATGAWANTTDVGGPSPTRPVAPMGGPPASRSPASAASLEREPAGEVAPARSRAPGRRVHIGTLQVTVQAPPAPARSAPTPAAPVPAERLRAAHRDPWDAAFVSFH